MATYKKHGNKHKKSSTEKVKQRSATAKIFDKLDMGATMFEDWVARNRKPILTIIAVLIIGVLGYLAYNNFIVKPREQEAVKEMSQPMVVFTQAMRVQPGANRDTLFMQSLHGAGSYGLLDVIDNYSNTDAGNIAEYAAGIAYLKLGNYKQAIAHLEKFSSDDEIYPAMMKGIIGDAFSENNQPEQALAYYEKAAQVRNNKFTTPKYLMKAAIVALQLNKKEKAADFLKRIKEDFPQSAQAAKVPAYLGMAENTGK